jgi:hypothetical protein
MRKQAFHHAATKPEQPVHFPSYRRQPVSIPASFALVKAYAKQVSHTATQPGFRLSPE